MTRKTDRVT